MASNESLRVKRINSIDSNQMETNSTQGTQYEDVSHSNITPINNNIKSLTNDSSLQINGKITNRQTSQTSPAKTADKSLFSLKAIQLMILWYFFSFTTLFMNKYIVSYESGDTTMLGVFQLMFCAICSFVQIKYWHKIKALFTKQSKRINEKKFQIKRCDFSRSLIVVGSLRFSTILLGLIALYYVPVSFAETIKSSAPVFTVFISMFVLGESTSLIVILSLIPVMSGLALCSAYELSFTLIGFVCSLATNLSECFQNVFSKKLLTIERCEPLHLQFYTSLSSIIIQIPCILFLVDLQHFIHSICTEKNLLLTYILAGISFHCQSFTEYLLLSFISPVTHSVANTAKRAFLIWLSVIIFGNPVTTLSWIGSGFVISGVFLYNKAREISLSKESTGQSYSILKQSETHDV